MDEKEFEDICYICRRPESKAGRMFHLPNNICICDDCMHKTMDAVSQFDYQQMMNNPMFMNMLNNPFHPYGDPTKPNGTDGTYLCCRQQSLWRKTFVYRKKAVL